MNANDFDDPARQLPPFDHTDEELIAAKWIDPVLMLRVLPDGTLQFPDDSTLTPAQKQVIVNRINAK